MTRGCIFDLDGTLLNTLVSLANSFNRTLERLGYPTHPVDSYRYFIGDGLRRCVERCLPPGARDESNIEAVMTAQQADYELTWKHDAHPYDGMTELLAVLEDLDVPLGVLSNKNHSFTVRCVRHFFPATSFTAVVGHSTDVPHKPDPTGALEIARAMALPPGNIALIGDTATDVGTAAAAGMVAVGVSWGFRDCDELKNAGAQHIISHPSEVTALLHRDQRRERGERGESV